VIGDVTRKIVNRAELPVLVIRTGHGPVQRFKGLLGILSRYVRNTSRHFRISSGKQL
jgi:hypothetical protein